MTEIFSTQFSDLTVGRTRFWRSKIGCLLDIVDVRIAAQQHELYSKSLFTVTQNPYLKTTWFSLDGSPVIHDSQAPRSLDFGFGAKDPCNTSNFHDFAILLDLRPTHISKRFRPSSTSKHVKLKFWRLDAKPALHIANQNRRGPACWPNRRTGKPLWLPQATRRSHRAERARCSRSSPQCAQQRNRDTWWVSTSTIILWKGEAQCGTGLMAIVQCVYTPRTTLEEEETKGWHTEVIIWDGWGGRGECG